jgi:hypothetical protein
MLQKHPLFCGNTNEEVLNEIHEFCTHLSDWTEKAIQSGFFDEKIWDLITQLLVSAQTKITACTFGCVLHPNYVFACCLIPSFTNH